MGLSNGIFCCGPSIFVSVAFALSITSSSLCNFVQLDEGNFWRFGQFSDNGIEAVSFWCFEYADGNRYSYGSTFETLFEEDKSFTTARALGMTANVIGFLVWVIYLFAGCIPFPPAIFMGTGFLALLACMFEGFKFWILRSELFCDNEALGCSLDTGGRCSISASVFWFVAALMTCAHGKERMGASDRDGDRDNEVRDSGRGEPDRDDKEVGSSGRGEPAKDDKEGE